MCKNGYLLVFALFLDLVLLAKTDMVKVQCITTGGMCKVITDCPVALEALARGRPHNLLSCGFLNAEDEIVCCPDSSSKPVEEPKGRVGTLKRKYIEACEKYQRDASTLATFSILGGQNTTDNEFPHMAALGFTSGNEVSFECGATLISKNFLLTAAHCVAIKNKPDVVRMGSRLLDESAMSVGIKNITWHEQYSTESKLNDIALIELSEPINFTEKVFPACLWGEDAEPDVMIATGWGNIMNDQSDTRSKHLLKALLFPRNLQQCNETYFKRSFGLKAIHLSQLCAHSAKSDTCGGDSGGPLQIKLPNGVSSIVGIVSYSYGCGGNVPGVYTRVSKFLDWIEGKVWK